MQGFNEYKVIKALNMKQEGFQDQVMFAINQGFEGFSFEKEKLIIEKIVFQNYQAYYNEKLRIYDNFFQRKIKIDNHASLKKQL